MKKTLMNIGGLVLFYSVIVIGVLLLNLRFSYINEISTKNINETYMAMNK